jgi:hypothetical protein
VCDVEGTPWWVEAKVGALTNPRAAIRQAEQATDGRPVVAICKDNAKRPGKAPDVWVTLRLDAFLALLAASEGVALKDLVDVQSEDLVPASVERAEPGTSNPPTNARISRT